MDATLFGFGYLSVPTVAFSDDTLNALLLSARRHNGMRQITGKLIVLEDGDQVVRFAQWIEGPREEIELCLQRIYADTRHGAIEIRWSGKVPRRRFAGWDMAYDVYDPAEWTEFAHALTAV